ncbi:MAG: ankyrin repeat domain-containing protein [Bacteroidales bacterium]
MRHLRCISVFFLLLAPFVSLSQSEEVMEAYNLHTAIKNKEMEKVQKMIAEGTDPGYQFNGKNALHVACQSGSPEMVQLILKAGVGVNERTEEGKGMTPLQYAIFKSSVPAEVIRILLDHGAKVNAKGPNGAMPIHFAIRKSGDETESLKIAKILIEYGAELDPEKEGNSTALKAAIHNRADMLELVLKNGADPNKHSKEMKYPIHYAVYNVDLKSVKLLKEYGADLEVKDKAGKTALDYAGDKVNMKAFDEKRKKKYQEIVDVLSE